MPKKSEAKPNPAFEKLIVEFKKNKKITEGKMFGATGLKYGNKVFAMLVKNELVVKLPAVKVNALVAEKAGKYFDPGHGKPMKEWISISSAHSKKWLGLSKEALEYVSSL